MKPRVLLDIDGVIANFYREFARFLNEEHGCTLDLDQEPTDYSFEEWGHGVDQVNLKEASGEWVKNGGFARVPIFPGAAEFVGELVNLCDVFIVTARIGDWDRRFPPNVIKEVKEDTKKWLEDYGIPTNKLFFAHEKIDFCKEMDIGTMIEDKLSTALNGAKNGINTILINRGYNGSAIDRFRIYRAYSYEDVLNRIKKMYS